MADINKRIRIDGDASGMTKAFNDIENSGNVLYTRLKRDAEEYSENLKLQSQYIDKLLSLESRRANEYNAQVKRQLDLDKEQALKNATSERERRFIEQEHEERTAQQKRYYAIEQQQLLEAKQMTDIDYGDVRGRRASDFEPEQDVDPNDPRFRRAASRTGRFLRGAGTAMTAGLGIGFAFGIFGFLFEMVKSANELDKTMVGLQATMSGVDKTSLGAAASIGKSTAQMAELTRQGAMLSGGELGSLTGMRTLQLAQFAKAFGVDENLLLQQFPTGRMGGADVGKELLDLLREMLRTGTVSGDNMSKLTEKIEYWSRLNQIQSEQMLTVSPQASAFILGAMEETGLPILSDQRQLEFIEKLNNSLTKPGNEFIRAYNLSNLTGLTGGDIIQTLKLEEQGIFGKGVLRSAFEQYERDFAGGRSQDAIISLSRRFGISIQESEMLFNQMFADTEEARQKKTKFLDSLDRISDINEQYSMAVNEQDPERKRRLEQEYRETSELLAKDFNIRVPQLAAANTAISDAILATYTNVMAKSGGRVLESLGSLIMNPDVVKSVDLLAQGISYGAAEILNVAAEIFMKAVEIFEPAVKMFAAIFGNETVSEEDKKRNYAISAISDIYGFQTQVPIPQDEKEKLASFTKRFIRDGKIFNTDFSDEDLKMMREILSSILLDFYADPNPLGRDRNNPRTGLPYWGSEKYKQRREEFQDLQIETKSSEKDTSSIIVEPIRELAKVMRDNVNELKRNNFAVPGVYSEAYG